MRQETTITMDGQVITGMLIDEKHLVTKDGRVFSLGKVWRELKQQKTRHGYLTVSIYGHNRLVHRLVAEAYIDNPRNCPQVNHIDGVKTHNNVENLEWCPAHENMKHAYRIGLIPHSEIQHFGYCGGVANRKLTELEAAVIRSDRTTKLKDLAKAFGVSIPTISEIRAGHRYQPEPVWE